MNFVMNRCWSLVKTFLNLLIIIMGFIFLLFLCFYIFVDLQTLNHLCILRINLSFPSIWQNKEFTKQRHDWYGKFTLKKSWGIRMGRDCNGHNLWCSVVITCLCVQGRLLIVGLGTICSAGYIESVSAKRTTACKACILPHITLSLALISKI